MLFRVTAVCSRASRTKDGSPRRGVAGIRRRVAALLTAIGPISGGDAGREICLAAGTGCAVDERGFHAHCDYQFRAAGKPFPASLKKDAETTIIDKAQVIDWLKQSLETVKTAHSQVTPAELAKHVKIANRDATVDASTRI